MELKASDNEYHENHDLRGLRSAKLLGIGRYLDQEFNLGLNFVPWVTDADNMRRKIIAAGKPIPLSFFKDEPVNPGDQNRFIKMQEPRPPDGVAVDQAVSEALSKPKKPETVEPVVVGADGERESFVKEMEDEKSFFKVRAMAKNAGAQVERTDKKQDLIDKVRAL